MRIRALPTAAALVAGLAAVAHGWTGARWSRYDRSERPEVARSVQAPRLSYHAVAPQIDADGHVWLFGTTGTVRRLTPYLGETARLQFGAGLEAPALRLPDGQWLAVDRDGDAWRFAEAGTTGTRIARGLTPAHGRACLSGDVTLWPDIHGGAAMVAGDGEVLNRFSAEIYGQRRQRGGAAAACDGAQALLVLAGGRIVALEGRRVLWTQDPATLAGKEFAPRVIHRGDRWVACAREEHCFAVVSTSGDIAALAPFGSIDGPVAGGEDRLWFATRDGRLIETDGNLVVQRDVAVSSGPGWLLAGPDRPAEADRVLWLLTVTGELYRVDADAGSGERVYGALPGVSDGGLWLSDGTALITTNLGSVLTFELR